MELEQKRIYGELLNVTPVAAKRLPDRAKRWRLERIIRL